MMRILFVSEDDSCRAPLARELSRRLADELVVPGLDFESCGIAVERGGRVPPEYVSLGRVEGVDLARTWTQPLTAQLLEKNDAALCMTLPIAEYVRASYPKELGGKAVLFTKACGLGDSYGDVLAVDEGPGGFARVAGTVRAATGSLVRLLEFEHRIPVSFGVGAPLDTGPKGPPAGLSPVAEVIWYTLYNSPRPLKIAELVTQLAADRIKADAVTISRMFQGELKRHVRALDGGVWETLAKRRTAGGPPRVRIGTGAPSSSAAPPPPPSAGGAAALDPGVRMAVGRYMLDFLRRSFDPVSSEELLFGLKLAGYTIPAEAMHEILTTELRRAVERRGNDTWAYVEGASTEKNPRQSAAGNGSAAPPPPPPPPREKEQSPPPAPREEFRIKSIAQAFEIIGIAESAAVDEIKKTYRDLMKRYHPDRFMDDPEFRSLAEEKARRINLAYDYLKSKRQDL